MGRTPFDTDLGNIYIERNVHSLNTLKSTVKEALMHTVIERIVERGDQRGRTLGFPAANTPIDGDSEPDGAWIRRRISTGCNFGCIS